MRRLLVALAILVATTVQAQSLTFQRGDLVRLRNVAKPAVLKIVGIPTDRIRADASGVYVNDVAVTGFSREFLTRFTWETKVIPNGHYFVLGEQRLNDDVSENMSIVPASSLTAVP